MKYVLCLLLFSFSALANVQMELSLSNNYPKQGEIVTARLIIKETQGQSSLQGLKGKNFEKTLYLLSLSPFILKNGNLESEVKIIFLKIPQTTFVRETLNGQDVMISWGDITVSGTEEAESFLLGDFDIPKKKKFFVWIMSGFLFLLVVLGTLWITRKNKKKKVIRLKKLALKEELVSCHSYEEVVSIWKKKLTYLSVFPQFENNFKNLEQVLFKYQFKPSQTEKEKSEVMEAYKQFRSEIMGGEHGV